MKIPKGAEEAEIEFTNNTPVITKFYFLSKDETLSLEEAGKEYMELGGNY